HLLRRARLGEQEGGQPALLDQQVAAGDHRVVERVAREHRDEHLLRHREEGVQAGCPFLQFSLEGARDLVDGLAGRVGVGAVGEREGERGSGHLYQPLCLPLSCFHLPPCSSRSRMITGGGAPMMTCGGGAPMMTCGGGAPMMTCGGGAPTMTCGGGGAPINTC